MRTRYLSRALGLVLLAAGLSGCDLLGPRQAGPTKGILSTLSVSDGALASLNLISGGTVQRPVWPEAFPLRRLSLNLNSHEAGALELEVHYPQEGQVVHRQTLGSSFTQVDLDTTLELRADTRLGLRLVDTQDWLRKEWFRGLW